MSTYTDGHGAAWLDLLSTLHGRYRPTHDELIGDGPTLADFLGEHGLPTLRPASDAEAEAAREVREVLHRVTVAAVAAGRIDPADLARLNEIAAVALRPTVRADDDGTLGAEPVPTADAAIARLVTEAMADLTGPRRQLLRPCGDPQCSGYFLDYTGRRRWCSDQRCGVRNRVRAHRARTTHA